MSRPTHLFVTILASYVAIDLLAMSGLLLWAQFAFAIPAVALFMATLDGFDRRASAG